jgi:hypothetical protein
MLIAECQYISSQLWGIMVSDDGRGAVAKVHRGGRGFAEQNQCTHRKSYCRYNMAESVAYKNPSLEVKY